MPSSPLRVGPLRVGVVGANAERSWAKDSHVPALAQRPLGRSVAEELAAAAAQAGVCHAISLQGRAAQLTRLIAAVTRAAQDGRRQHVRTAQGA